MLKTGPYVPWPDLYLALPHPSGVSRRIPGGFTKLLELELVTGWSGRIPEVAGAIQARRSLGVVLEVSCQKSFGKNGPG